MTDGRTLAGRWLPVLVWMALIFIGSSPVGTTENTSRFLGPLLRWLMPGMSETGIHQAQVVIRKTGHLLEYAILGALIWRARRCETSGVERRWSRREAVLAVALAALYAVTDELHQHFVPGRLGSAGDVLIDTLGAALGVGAVWGAGRWRGCW